MNVSAKDLATGKQQSIRITASSGLSKEEIDRLIKDADLNSAEDRKRKSLAEARNTADSIIYAATKTLNEAGGRVDSQTKTTIEDTIQQLKKAMEGENTNEIRRLADALKKQYYNLSETLYRRASGTAAPDDDRKKDNDTIDADFNEVA